ncbi:MAG: Asp-tRNA(Asn)/Glu-tRNA(Gln) amidotransferase subunit GatB [Alphaproteobacteria bacterium]|nr:Asp-tRNA(Asn)/Glu-tRNA(Gln) amidotransferase subunit GatB [Alphaproteobacteria bacterium]MBV9376732.1 Asp-tRNA(Asn)/Glu-tRNA(Gln) amidotransferase subunit GatB [Alphaproteobacteria bacterium]
MIEGATGPWEAVIGLEVHAQVVSKAKLFSGAATDFGAEPNSQVSLVDAAFPGMLPVINRFCVELAVKTGLGLEAEIRLESVFDRKNYFYPDLPPGYQISQYQQPVVGRGKLTLDMSDGTVREIGITRVHLEQDAGKSLHDQHPSLSYVDLNRAGIALMEIVSEPDLRSAEEAGLYLRKLRSILRYLGTCDGNMEEGSLRCDCNVSMRRPGEPYGTRCEIKNLNSVRYVMQAIEYEGRRQIEILEKGGAIEQQTRLFDVARGITRSMRSKEEAHDYRYFPDPDLLPLVLDPGWVARLRAELPELPDAKKARFVSQYGLSPDDAGVLVAEKETALFFERVATGRDPKAAAHWIMGDLFGALNRFGIGIEASPVSAEQLGALIDLIADGTLSSRLAKDVFAEMVATRAHPASIVEAKGLRQVTDQGEIAAAIDAVLAANSDKFAEYRAGRDKLYGFFVGQIMRATAGKANPALVNRLLKEKLAQ